MNTPTNDQQRSNMMALDGLSLMLKRSLSKLVADVTAHGGELSMAASADFDNVALQKLLSPEVDQVLRDLEQTIATTQEDLGVLADYWNSLPWSELIAAPDPRAAGTAPLTPEAEAELLKDIAEQECRCQCERQAYMEYALREALRCRDEQGSPVTDGMAATETVAEGPTFTSPPGPDFDPGLLASKRVVNVKLKNDVRTKHTIGDPVVEHAVGGPPALWLESVDGTRVTLHRDDIPGIIETLTNAIAK